MRNIEIDLAQPFEKVLAAVLSLPAGCGSAGAERLQNQAELKQAIRGLHQAANGRSVETIIGLIPIAPPVAPHLKEKPFRVTTQIELLIEAATRIICGPAQFDSGMPMSERVSSNRRGRPARREKAFAAKRYESGIDAAGRRFRQPPSVAIR